MSGKGFLEGDINGGFEGGDRAFTEIGSKKGADDDTKGGGHEVGRGFDLRAALPPGG